MNLGQVVCWAVPEILHCLPQNRIQQQAFIFWWKLRPSTYCLFSTHLILIGRKEIVLFNDTLNKFYSRLYGIKHMVNDHSDSERGKPLPPHALLFSISRKGCFICTSSHRQDNTYHSLCYTSRGALAGTRNSSMGRSDEPLHHERTLLPQSYISLLISIANQFSTISNDNFKHNMFPVRPFISQTLLPTFL